MKAVAIAAIIGAASVLAVAGLGLAGPVASVLGTPDDGEVSGGLGHMGGFDGSHHMNQNQNQYNGDSDDCPRYNQYNYSYDSGENRSCPCMG